MYSLQEIKKTLSDVYSGGELQAVVRILVEDLLGMRIMDFLLGGEVELCDCKKLLLDNAVERLKKGEPIQHVIGFTWFCGYKFNVDKSVLIPRPETSELVDIICRENEGISLRLLDIGTGSGCIAVSLALRNPGWSVEAWDISASAVRTAQDNAKNNNTNVLVMQVDVFEADVPDGSYDVIVSNPPYITPSEIPDMENNVLDYEPHNALFVPEDNPLLFYYRIAVKGLGWLSENGRLYFEINRRFHNEMEEMLVGLGYRNVSSLKDYNGNYRFVKAVR